MRKVLLSAFVVMLFSSFGQTVRIPSNSKADLMLIDKDVRSNEGVPSDNIMDRFAIHMIGSEYYVSCLAKTNGNFSSAVLSESGIISGKPINDVVSLKIPIHLIPSLDQIPGIQILQLAGKIKPHLDKAVKDTRADSVHLGIDLPQSYTGKDVLIGITDWGFDYTSPMFYDTLMQQTRILAAWDQFKTSGPNPVGYAYGTEYNDPASLIAAGSDTANIYSYSTHGTHVAGIAGGGGAGTNYRGFAFDAQFLFVTFLVDEGAVLDAWEWMYQKAQTEQKRLVVNMSWGLYHIGTLDGTSLLSQAIDGYASQGVVFANSAGNNGDVTFHIHKDFSNDTIASRINFYSYASSGNVWGQSVHLWGEPGLPFEAGIKVLNGSNVLLVESPFYATNTITGYIDTFLVTGLDTIWYNISADAAHPMNGKPQMRLRVRNLDSGLKVLLKATAADGNVHMWNVTELSNDVGNWGMPFSTAGSGTIAGDANYGVSEPSVSSGVISVAAYASAFQTPSGSTTGGGIASFSSFGPRIDEVMKPEISAPGVSVASSISSFTDASYSSVASVDFQNRTYPFARFSGTSMASPAVAGICALILEANPYLTAGQVKYILKVTAREDDKTGDIPVTGSTRWGWGKVNAYLAVKLALGTTGIEDIDKELTWSISPNPATDQLVIKGETIFPDEVQIISLDGRIMDRCVHNGVLDVSDLGSGKYWVRIVRGERVEQLSFIRL
jgi:minor extracellular serine protease Vpr